MVKQISAESKFFNRIQTPFQPENNNDVVNLDYLNNNYTSALTWRQSVISTINDPPIGPSIGDRYIIGTAPTGIWDGRANVIAEYELSGYNYQAALEGYAIVDKNIDLIKIFDGTNWDIIDCGVTNHNSLSGLQGGTTDEYFHLTSAQNTNVATIIAAGVQNLTAGEIDQLAKINNEIITATQWGYLGFMDQHVSTISDVRFHNISGTAITVSGNITSIHGNISTTDGNINTATGNYQIAGTTVIDSSRNVFGTTLFANNNSDFTSAGTYYQWNRDDDGGTFICNNPGGGNTGGIHLCAVLTGTTVDDLMILETNQKVKIFNDLEMNGVAVLDSSRNITNILGITNSGNINTTAGNYQINGTSVIDTSRNIANVLAITNSGNINTTAGNYQINGTTVINTSRNITNVLAITNSGNINTTAGNYQINGTTAIDSSRNIFGRTLFSNNNGNFSTAGTYYQWDRDSDGSTFICNNPGGGNTGGIHLSHVLTSTTIDDLMVLESNKKVKIFNDLEMGGVVVLDSSRNITCVNLTTTGALTPASLTSDDITCNTLLKCGIVRTTDATNFKIIDEFGKLRTKGNGGAGSFECNIDTNFVLTDASVSMRAKKHDILDLEDTINLDKYYDLRPVSFSWNEDMAPETACESIGFIAEEVNDIYPQYYLSAYNMETGKLKGVHYNKLNVLTIGVVQKHKKLIDDNINQIDNLKVENVNLKSEIDNLKVENVKLKSDIDKLHTRLDFLQETLTDLLYTSNITPDKDNSEKNELLKLLS